jgi:signal transduction histidine kinase
VNRRAKRGVDPPVSPRATSAATRRGRSLVRFRSSLLTRVALTFALAVALTALALALAAYYLTKDAQNDSALNEALEQSRLNLTIAESMLPAAPAPADYEALMSAFRIRGDFSSLIMTGTETYRSGLDVTDTPITADLAAAVAEGRVRYQTVSIEGQPAIVVGSQLGSGALTVYFFFPQGERLADLADLRNILVGAGLLLAVLGAIGGYALARRLLRPVRETSRAALQMSRGDLDIRLPAGADEFGVLSASFNHMAANLQAQMLSLEAGQARERRFAADVTHELRTPIAALVGEASLLKSQVESDPSSASPEIQRLAQMFTRDVGRLRQLVDDLLEVCRLDAQAAESLIEPVDLESFLARLVEAHGWSKSVRVGQAADRAASEPAGGAGQTRPPLMVMVDKRRLERIVVNLIDNALVHGASPVTVEPRAVEPRAMEPASQDARMVAVAITDSGAGIPLQDLPHVFDRFFKADPSRSAGGGSGLGLAIARENARLLGGDLTAANAPQGGARFVLTLPWADL